MARLAAARTPVKTPGQDDLNAVRTPLRTPVKTPDDVEAAVFKDLMDADHGPHWTSPAKSDEELFVEIAKENGSSVASTRLKSGLVSWFMLIHPSQAFCEWD